MVDSPLLHLWCSLLSAIPWIWEWCYKLVMNLFSLEVWPSTNTLPKFMSCLSSICDLDFTCIECIRSTSYGKMNYMIDL